MLTWLIRAPIAIPIGVGQHGFVFPKVSALAVHIAIAPAIATENCINVLSPRSVVSLKVIVGNGLWAQDFKCAQGRACKPKRLLVVRRLAGVSAVRASCAPNTALLQERPGLGTEVDY